MSPLGTGSASGALAIRPVVGGLALLLAFLGLGLAILLAADPMIATACVAGALLLGFCLLRPLGGLVLILVTVSFLGSESLLRLHFGWQWVEADLLLGAAVLGWGARSLARGETLRIGRLEVAFAIFGLFLLLGAALGLGAGHRFEDLRSELRPPAYMFATYAIVRSSIRRPAQARRMMTVLAVAAVLSALKALIVYGTVPLAPAGGPEERIWATRVMNSSGVKRVIAQGAEIYPVLATLWILPALPGISSIRRRLLGWAAVATLLLAVLVSMTRSYWLGLAAGFGALLCAHRFRVGMRIGREALGAILLLVCFALLLQSIVPGFDLRSLTGPAGQRALGTLMGGVDPSARGRIAELESIRALVAASPWTGSGLGGTYLFYSSLTGGLRVWEFTHNSYAHWALKLGIPGLLSALVVLGLGLASAVSWLRRAPSVEERTIASGLLASLFALLVLSLTAPWLTHYVGAAWAGLIIGCCESMRAGAIRRQEGGE